MKFYSLSVFVILLLMSLSFVFSSSWIDTAIEYKSSPITKIRVIYHKDLLEISLKSLLDTIEKDSVLNGISKKTKGIFAKSDILVFSKRYLFWFSKSSKGEGRQVRSAGGLLAGLWELTFDKKSKNLNFKNYDIKNKFAPSLLLAGSTKENKLFGQDIFGGYLTNNKKVIWSLEYSKNVKVTKKTGKDILSIDKGAYSADDGVFIQFEGILGNSPILGDGIDSITDTDPRKGIEGKTIFRLNYRIPCDRLEFISEIEFQAVKNNFGPITNAYIAMYLPGYEPNNLVYASNPELMPVRNERGNSTDFNSHLENVEINKYFRNSAVKKSYFYDIFANKRTGNKMTARTPSGRGRILCLGGPAKKIGFLCGYPNNDYIPKDAYEEYTLEINDNKNVKIGKFHSLNYKLISTPQKTITINQGEKLIMIMRYKLINASVPLPEKSRKVKFLKVK